MKRFIGLAIFLTLLLSACSGSSNSSESNRSDQASKATEAKSQDQAAPKTDKLANTNKSEQQQRMVIYNADLRLQVEDFKVAQAKIEALVSDMNGYIVQSNVSNQENQQLQGSLTVRVPETDFEIFLKQAEQLSVKVLSRNVTGKDVTEEYVDLEARLKTKQVVEERLLSFMKNAKETKELLQISNDLAKVQEEIERVKGRMKYLQNQTRLSTVNITLIENKVQIPSSVNGELNTWEKVNKQFKGSVNFILSASSAVIVFLIGNSPLFLLLGVLIVFILYVRKRSKKSER